MKAFFSFKKFLIFFSRKSSQLRFEKKHIKNIIWCAFNSKCVNFSDFQKNQVFFSKKNFFSEKNVGIWDILFFVAFYGKFAIIYVVNKKFQYQNQTFGRTYSIGKKTFKKNVCVEWMSFLPCAENKNFGRMWNSTRSCLWSESAFRSETVFGPNCRTNFFYLGQRIILRDCSSWFVLHPKKATRSYHFNFFPCSEKSCSRKLFVADTRVSKFESQMFCAALKMLRN